MVAVYVPSDGSAVVEDEVFQKPPIEDPIATEAAEFRAELRVAAVNEAKKRGLSVA